MTTSTSSFTRIFRREKRRLDEQYVQDAFHAFLKSSLARAKAERLLDVNALSTAEGDLIITGAFLQASSKAYNSPRIDGH